MIVKKILLVASAATLMSTSAWALPGHAPSHHGTHHAPSTTPVGPPSTPNSTDNPGASNHSQNGNHSSDQGNKGRGNDPGKPSHPAHPSHPSHPSHPGQSQKCKAHNVAYVVSGTLVSQTLVKNADGTYSGGVIVNVTHTNHHAAGDEGMTKSYTLTDARVTFDNGSVGFAGITTGDRVKVIGKITTLSKKCSQTGFTAVTTIRKVIFRKP